MVNLPYYNSRNQICGVYNTESRTYHTKRFAIKGQSQPQVI